MANFTDFFKSLTQYGPFAGGTVFGCLISYFFFKLASKERIERHRIDLEREAQLMEQNQMKDKRIDKLHSKLGKMQKRKA